MEKKYQILGHHNFALSIILETLFALYGKKVDVEIISNLLPSENTLSAYAYLVEGMDVKEVFHTDWKPRSYPCMIAAMSGDSRKKVFDFFLENYFIGLERYENLIHPTAVLPHQLQLGKGVNIGPSVTIAPFAEIGDMVLINRCASVGHHSKIGDFANLNPSSVIAGCCNIGTGVTIGMGATVIDQVSIGDHSIIGAGALVTKDIPPGVIAYGAPAKVVRRRNQ